MKSIVTGLLRCTTSSSVAGPSRITRYNISTTTSNSKRLTRPKPDSSPTQSSSTEAGWDPVQQNEHYLSHIAAENQFRFGPVAQNVKAHNSGESTRDGSRIADDDEAWLSRWAGQPGDRPHQQSQQAFSPDPPYFDGDRGLPEPNLSRRPSISDALSPSWQDPAPLDPPRKLRGIHNRAKRKQGLTPDESHRINKQIEQILHSMDSFDGSFPSQDRLAGFTPTFFGPASYKPEKGYNAYKRVLEMPETEEDEAVIMRLDELKEEMSIQPTDVELVKWAKENVFQPMSNPANTRASENSSPIFPPVYPRILGHLLSFVRRTFNNPHLVLALFQHAQTQSPESYLTGCLAPAYNEVLKVRWESFRDLGGIEAGLKEMDKNAVGWDRATAKIVDKVVADVSRDVVNGVGWEERYGKNVHHRLAILEARLQKDIVEQQRFYEHSLREKQKARMLAKREGGRPGYIPGSRGQSHAAMR